MNRYWLQRHNADTECIKNAVRSMNEDIRDLSKYCDELEKENERIEKEWKNKLDQVTELTNRIYKAIEYIKEHNCIATIKEYKPTEYEYCCSADLLSILQGEE